jgi:hypothetical protein
MRAKQVVRFFLLAFACCSLAVAQDSALVNVTGGGTKGTIPLWTAHHKIGNSIVTQSGTAINVAGGVNTVLGGSSSVDSVSGSNTSGPGTSAGAGVYGQISTTGQSGTGQLFAFGGAGTWGDGGLDGNYAVLGTTDNKAAGIFQANGTSYYTLFGFNYNTAGFPFDAINAGGFGCNIDPVGNLTCTGAKNAVVSVDGGKHKVALAAIESPKNWFEDFGSAQLRGGVAVVRLDSRFMQTTNTSREYHVFLTPNGDCKGLYVHQKNGNSFEVRELGGGNSSVRFDYRITALRKKYENVRFADHSREFSADSSGRVFATK